MESSAANRIVTLKVIHKGANADIQTAIFEKPEEKSFRPVAIKLVSTTASKLKFLVADEGSCA